MEWEWFDEERVIELAVESGVREIAEEEIVGSFDPFEVYGEVEEIELAHEIAMAELQELGCIEFEEGMTWKEWVLREDEILAMETACLDIVFEELTVVPLELL